jgi:CHAT domain-containing protein
MSWRIIVASSDEYQRDELKKGADAIAEKITATGDAAEVEVVTTVVDVRKLLRGANKDLVIATAALSERAPTPGIQNQAGLELIKAIQAQPSPPPCILVSDRSEHRSLTKAMPRCQGLQVGAATDYIRDCVTYAKDLDVWVGHSGARPVQDEFALIEVDVPDDTRTAMVRYVIDVKGCFEDPDFVPLGLKQKKVDDLVADSRKLSERFSRALKSERAYERWQQDYRSLGERFYKLLDTATFKDHLRTIEGVVKGRDLDIRLRFSLGRFVFDGLWESILNAEGEHLMLKATITRRARGTVVNNFAKAQIGAVGPLNILVIGSTVDDNSVPKGPGDVLWKKHWGTRQLESLPHIVDEIAAIKDLERLPHKVKVHVLSGEERHEAEDGWSLAEVVRTHLAENPNRYDVVHFAGHALFATSKMKKAPPGKGKTGNQQPDDERGYLVFSGKGQARAIPIAVVAGWLKDTSVDLVYLSCCRSSASRAAAEFAKNSIRTTIGFSWDLVDERAVDFTRQFYAELLKNRLNVCSALRRARKDLHEVYESGDPIWASPVLFAQPKDWKHVEGVLRPPVRP